MRIFDVERVVAMVATLSRVGPKRDDAELARIPGNIGL